MNEICTDVHLLDSCGKDSSRKFSWNLDGEIVHRKQGSFLSLYVDDKKMAGKKQKMAPMRKKLMKTLIFTNFIS